jgi:hypothetical protein
MIFKMTKKRLLLPTLGILLLQFISCSGQDPILVEPNPIYEACCGADPVEFKDANGYVYVPNLFTPNRDGQNDLFKAVFNPDDVLYIGQYTIYKDTIEEPGEGYYNSGPFDPKTESKWWDGTLPDGTKHIGPFEYTIQLSMRNGSLVTVEGRACLVECGVDAAEFKDRKGCFFESQSSSGRLDINLPNKEEDCFK